MLNHELTANTEPGRRLIALAEQLGPELAECAGKHDHDASYPFAGIDALRAHGYFAAPVPEALGGLGVSSDIPEQAQRGLREAVAKRQAAMQDGPGVPVMEPEPVAS